MRQENTVIMEAGTKINNDGDGKQYLKVRDTKKVKL